MNHYSGIGVWAVGAAAVTAIITVALCAAEPAAPAKPVQKQFSAEQKQQLEKAKSLAADAARSFEAGKYGKTIGPAQEALRIRREVLGPEHPDTVASLSDLAVYFATAGEFAKSLPLRQQALEIRRKVLGPEHPDTAASLAALANLYVRMGDYARALPLHQQALEVRRRVFGLQHPETGRSLDALAELYEHTGEYAKALPLRRQVLEIRRKVLGPEHRDTAESVGNLAYLYGLMGNYAQALPLYRQALEIDRKVYGPEHPLTVEDLRTLGDLYSSMGDYTGARPLLEQAWEINRRALGPEHPDTIKCLAALAGLYELTGDYAKALPMFQQEVKSSVRIYGPAHPDTAASLSNLAALYKCMGEYAKALPLVQRSIEIQQKTLSPESPDVAFALSNLADLYGLMGDNAAAVPILERVVEIDRKALGVEHADTIEAIGRLGTSYAYLGQYAKAIPLCQRALETRRKVFGSQSPVAAVSASNLAAIYESMGQCAKALPLCQEAVEIERRRLGPEHPLTAMGLGNLASSHLLMGDAAKALPLWQQMLEIDRKALGPRHPDTAAPLAGVARCYCAMGRYSEAMQPARDCALIDNQVLDDVAPSVPDSQAMNLVAAKGRRRDELLSAAIRAGADPDAAYTLLWQRRGLVLRIGEMRRQTGLAAGASPEVGRTFAEYRAVRAELARLAMTPVGADPTQARQRLDRVNACAQRKERMETELARLMPALRRQLQANRRPPGDLQAKLPPDAAFVDFVEYHRIGPLAKNSGTKGVAWPPCYAAFVLVPGKPTACVDLGSADAINAAIASWSEALAEAKSGRSAATLRQLAWEPIERRLPRETKTVYLCPEGSLTRLCWAALPGRGEGVASAIGTRRVPATLADGTQRAPAAAERILLEDYALALVPSGQFLLDELTTLGPAPGERGTLLAVGDVTYDAHPAASRPAPLLLASAGLRSAATEGRRLYWPALPATAAELSDVIGAWRAPNANLVRLSQGEAATDRVMVELPHARWAHFATHGFFADKKFRSALQLPEGAFEQADLREGQRVTVAARNPLLLSGLVLAGANLPRQNDEFGVPQGDGGILTAEAIAMLPLDKLELAVLSACETGVGDVAGGEGVFGLQRAFHVAGARNVVASLWKVDDQATATLMQLFYRNLWQSSHPATPLAALREAQLALYRHPQWIEHPELHGREEGSRGPDLSKSAAPKLERPAGPPETGRQRLPPKYWAAFVLSGSGQ
jgi:CHAT domain-containing protein/tetratricopeptide (TPR) repeat protein